MKTKGISDLYAQVFNPVAGKNDTTNFPSGDLFQLAKAQRLALSNNSFVSSIKQEKKISFIRSADFSISFMVVVISWHLKRLDRSCFIFRLCLW